jgi:hypothetical protein
MKVDDIVFIAIAALSAVLVILVATLIWAMVMQRQSLARQKLNLFQIEESLELSRRAVELSERLLRLADQSVRNQEEVIRLLKELAGRADRPGEAAGGFARGVRLPGAGPAEPRD